MRIKAQITSLLLPSMVTIFLILWWVTTNKTAPPLILGLQGSEKLAGHFQDCYNMKGGKGGGGEYHSHGNQSWVRGVGLTWVSFCLLSLQLNENYIKIWLKSKYSEIYNNIYIKRIIIANNKSIWISFKCDIWFEKLKQDHLLYDNDERHHLQFGCEGERGGGRGR